MSQFDELTPDQKLAATQAASLLRPVAHREAHIGIEPTGGVFCVTLTVGDGPKIFITHELALLLATELVAVSKALSDLEALRTQQVQAQADARRAEHQKREAQRTANRSEVAA